MKTFLLTFALFGLCSTWPLRWGQCAEPTLSTTFPGSSFPLNTFLARRTKRVPWDKKQCVKLKINAKVTGNLKQAIFISQVDQSNGKLTSTGGDLVFEDPALGKGKLSGSKWIPSGDFRVVMPLATPPSLVVYSCVPYLFFFKKEYMWIFVNALADIPTQANNILNDAISKVTTLSQDLFEEVDHTPAKCSYST